MDPLAVLDPFHDHSCQQMDPLAILDPFADHPLTANGSTCRPGSIERKQLGESAGGSNLGARDVKQGGGGRDNFCKMNPGGGPPAR